MPVGVAVGREAHHLALVAVFREAEPLRDGRVEDPERVREEDAVEDREAGAVALREHRRGEVAEAVHGEDRRILERRDEERTRDVRLVVLDVVELGADLALVDAQRLCERRPHVAHLRRVLEPRLQVARAGPVANRTQELPAEVRLRIARHGDVIEVARGETRIGEAPRGGQLGKASAVLDAVEALLLGRRHELAVNEECRRRVAVIGVQTKDRGHAAPILSVACR